MLVRQQRDRRRHGIGQELRALAAAEDQQPERLAGLARADRACRAASQHRRPHRIAGLDDLAGELLGAADLGEAAGDRVDARRRGSGWRGPSPRSARGSCVGTLRARRGEQRRHGRIAAEADTTAGLDPARSAPRPAHAAARAPERARRARPGLRGERRRRDRCGSPRPGKSLAVGLGAVVGGEMHAPAARARAHAPAPRPETDGRRCRRRRAGRAPAMPSPLRPAPRPRLAAIDAAADLRGSGRRRVSASSRPMPKATAIIDEPP